MLIEAPANTSRSHATRVTAALDESVKFLSALFRNLPPGEWIQTWGINPHEVDPKTGKPKITVRGYSSVDRVNLAAIHTLNGRGVQMYVGCCSYRDPKRRTKFHVGHLHAFWVECDAKHFSGGKPAILARLRTQLPAELGPSVIVDSGHGYHFWWFLRGSIPVTVDGCPLTAEDTHADQEAYLKGLEDLLGGDHVHDVSRILRIPGTINSKDKAHPVPCSLVEFNPDRRYRMEDFELYRADPPAALVVAVQFSNNATGITLDELRCRPAMKTLIVGGHVPGGGYRSRSETSEAAIAALVEADHTDDEIQQVFQNSEWRIGEKYQEDGDKWLVRSIASARAFVGGKPTDQQGLTTLKENHWPSLAPEALHGLAGDIVRAIDPYTEADPVATLAHFLAAVGNVIGPHSHCRVQHDEHPARFNFGLVGATSKGRKGLSWSTPRRILSEVDEAWIKTRVQSGLSSGEGVIYHVRDAREELQPIKEKGSVIRYEMVMVDPGEQDKRLLIIEPELAVILRRMASEGNTLSAVIRGAWDSGNLSTLTKHSPQRATGAHVSIVGHITRDELLRYLSETERGNGFANRFIWLLVRRSKSLPEGEALPEAVLAPLIHRVQRAVTFAKQVRELRRDDEAREIWAAVYENLAKEKPGMLGAIISRAEAQVLRLSVCYAILDLSPVIRRPHLLAATALWDYAEKSARLIFGDATGNPVADRILKGLRMADGLTETEIRDLFQRNAPGRAIDQALDLLARSGLAHAETRPTLGRPITVWRATT